MVFRMVKKVDRKLVTFQVPDHLIELFEAAVAATGRGPTQIVTDCLEVAMRTVVEGYLAEQEAAKANFEQLLTDSNLPTISGKPRVKKTS